MKNPNGPYPGRQLFLGLTLENKPCFAYLVTGRSPESRERMAIAFADGVRIGPVGNIQYDSLRHYSAVKYDIKSGIVAVSNGIQTEAIFETYKLLYHTASQPGKDYLEKLMEGAGAEPDSYHTPRIGAIITYSRDNMVPVFIIGIKAHNLPARVFQGEIKPGNIVGISTYRGDMEKPEARDPDSDLPRLEFGGKTADELAGFLFDISAASHKGYDIRVCSLGGVQAGNRKWDISIRNVLLA